MYLYMLAFSRFLSPFWVHLSKSPCFKKHKEERSQRLGLSDNQVNLGTRSVVASDQRQPCRHCRFRLSGVTSGQDSGAGPQINKIICHKVNIKHKTYGRLNSTGVGSSVYLDVNYLGRLSSFLVFVWVSECDVCNVSHEDVEETWGNVRDDIFMYRV